MGYLFSGEYLEESFQLKVLFKISHKDQQVNVSLPLYVLFAEKARSQVQGLIGWVKFLKNYKQNVKQKEKTSLPVYFFLWSIYELF